MDKFTHSLWRLIITIFILSFSGFYAETALAVTQHAHRHSAKPAHHKKKHTTHHHKKPRHYVAATHANLNEGASSINFGTSMEARLVQFVQNSLENLRYSVYKPGGSHFDDSRGVYIADCSGFVDYVLKEIHPMAFSTLVDSMRVDKPNSESFYDFFADLDGQDDYWKKVNYIEELRPGDILVVRYQNSHGRETGGHVMVVMDKPVRDLDSFMVRVADSAPAGHSDDTRLPHVSGIGVGLLRLKADPDTGQPFAFAWRLGSRWQSNVKIAMARPTDVTD